MTNIHGTFVPATRKQDTFRIVNKRRVRALAVRAASPKVVLRLLMQLAPLAEDNA